MGTRRGIAAIAACDERRLLNRLRAGLLETFPAALTIAADDLGSPVLLKLLARWPARDQLAASGEEIEAFARAAWHGWPGRFAARVRALTSMSHPGCRQDRQTSNLKPRLNVRAAVSLSKCA